MSYRLPRASVTTCTSAGCTSAASHDDQDAAGRAAALSGWQFGAGTATCPAHQRRMDVLHFAA